MPHTSHLTPVEAQLQHISHLVDQTMAGLLPDDDQDEARLFEAMRYGSFNGGKRIRPFLLLCSADLFNVDRTQSLRAAAAIEFLHGYSLIHDDLPAMDDAELRRGKKTVHCAFDEATAILAGDALLTLAFEIMADHRTHHDALVRCQLVEELAKAAGARGMVGGQMLDLLAEKQTLDQHDIIRLQRLKTGALIGFSCLAGAIMGGATSKQRDALCAYAAALGLAYQIVDDVLDTTSDALTLGKPVSQDEAKGKATFVSLWGVERARAEAELLSQQAIEHLEIFGAEAEPLREIVKLLIRRSY